MFIDALKMDGEIGDFGHLESLFDFQDHSKRRKIQIDALVI